MSSLCAGARGSAGRTFRVALVGARPPGASRDVEAENHRRAQRRRVSSSMEVRRRVLHLSCARTCAGRAAHEGHRAEGLVALQRGAQRGGRRRRADGGRERARREGREGRREGRRGCRRASGRLDSNPPDGWKSQRAEQAVRRTSCAADAAGRDAPLGIAKGWLSACADPRSVSSAGYTRWAACRTRTACRVSVAITYRFFRDGRAWWRGVRAHRGTTEVHGGANDARDGSRRRSATTFGSARPGVKCRAGG